ncbi:MAG: hypothetical protein IT302_00100 [Dehalococcoidia bacterium]|nr:hypothetical protein [Dehalococcoidia bacterium]
MIGLGFSWGAFLVYLFALVFVVLGGFYGLIESKHPAVLAPILMGLFYFYLCWEAVVGDGDAPPPPSSSRGQG